MVWLYIFFGCTRACVCGCDGDVIGKDAPLWNASFKLTLSGCMVSICCVGFVSLDVVCDELNDCAWNVCL